MDSNNEKSFPVDRQDYSPESSDTESWTEEEEEEEFSETSVHEMKVDGHHLVEKKQKKIVFDPEGYDCEHRGHRDIKLIHSRSIDDRSCDFFENLTNCKECMDRKVETEMTPDELQKFEEDWSNLWKPQYKPERDWNLWRVDP